MRITVIGTGYLGAVHAACMAEIGHEVLGVDVDAAKIEALAVGRPPFHEPGLGGVLARNVEAGRLRFSTSLAEAAAFGDVHFVCVGTPQQPGSWAADLSYVDAVIDGLAPHLRAGALVVGKSTVPVGTAARLAERIHKFHPAAELAWTPSSSVRASPYRTPCTPTGWSSGLPQPAPTPCCKVYGPILDLDRTPWISTNLATAELVKTAANAFLATKISFINAMAEVCDAAGGDVVTLADAIGYDPRIGRRFLSAGIGFGGGCLPKDIRAFMARAGELGVDEALSFCAMSMRLTCGVGSAPWTWLARLAGGTFAGPQRRRPGRGVQAG